MEQAAWLENSVELGRDRVAIFEVRPDRVADDPIARGVGEQQSPCVFDVP